MLVEFSVENFRSIRERVTLSLIAANLRSGNQNLDDDNVIPVNSKLSLLRSVVMYGANASGKSNIFKAFAFMRDFVFNSGREGQVGDKISTEPFCLTESMAGKPATFETVFLMDGVQYRYGFSVTSKRVLAEWLYFQPTIREVELFTRDEQGIYPKPRFHAGRGVVEKTRTNALFLSVAAQFNSLVATEILLWYVQHCNMPIIVDSFRLFMPDTVRLMRKGLYRRELEELVSRFDVDIHGISLENIPASSDVPAAEDVDEPRARHIVRDEQNRTVRMVDFPIEAMESAGTKKLIALAGPVIDALTHGFVLLIDEIDARLHPLMTAALVRLFNSRETNPNNAQLICATHDTNLLDRRLFRRDQIYFVEKDRTSASRLYSLAEFKLEPEKGVKRTVRNDASYERDYIQGRYGAIPYIGDLVGLFSEELKRHQDEAEPEKILEAVQ